MEFTITALNGDSVRVEADNWLSAMGKALGFFDIEAADVSQLVCARTEDGAVQVKDGEAGHGWFVRQVHSAVAATPSARSMKEQWVRHQEKVETFDPNAPRPDIVMPDVTLRPAHDAQTTAERLFDLSLEIGSMSPEQAADAALDIARGGTGAEAACVALGTLDEPSLRVVAARGAGAAKVFGRNILFGEGLLGMCFDLADVIAVQDVDAGTPHVDQLGDDEHPTLSVLCVPLLDDDGTVRGAIQLLNSASRPFLQSDVDLVRSVAKTLANALVT